MNLKNISRSSKIHSWANCALLTFVVVSIVYFLNKSNGNYLKIALSCSTFICFLVWLGSVCICASTGAYVEKFGRMFKENFALTDSMRRAGRILDVVFVLLLFCVSGGFSFMLLAPTAPHDAVLPVMMTMIWVSIGPMYLVMRFLKEKAQWPTLVETYPLLFVSAAIGLLILYLTHSVQTAAAVAFANAVILIVGRRRCLKLFRS